MATHSNIFSWRILWTEEPSGLQSIGLQRVRQKLVTKQQQSSWSVLGAARRPLELECRAEGGALSTKTGKAQHNLL